MHSKSDNLGYLKDQNNVKFSGGFTPWTPTLDPLGRAQGQPPPPPRLPGGGPKAPPPPPQTLQL